MLIRIIKGKEMKKWFTANRLVLFDTGRELKSKTNGNAVKQKKLDF